MWCVDWHSEQLCLPRIIAGCLPRWRWGHAVPASFMFWLILKGDVLRWTQSFAESSEFREGVAHPHTDSKPWCTTLIHGIYCFVKKKQKVWLTLGWFHEELKVFSGKWRCCYFGRVSSPLQTLIGLGGLSHENGWMDFDQFDCLPTFQVNIKSSEL